MKKWIGLVLLFLIVGCTSTKPEQEKFTGKSETFKNEYYINYPDIKNISYYLQSDTSSIEVLKESNTELWFSFTGAIDIDVHDTSIVSYANYIKELVALGYQESIFDGTNGQTFELQNDMYIITITVVSNLEEWKKDNVDIEKVNVLDNQNIVYKITKK